MADVPINEDDPDWLGWWEIVKQHFPSLFDGTGPMVGQLMARFHGLVVRDVHQIEARLSEIDAELRSCTTPVRHALMFQRFPSLAQDLWGAEDYAVRRRQQRERIIASLQEFSS